MVKLKFYDLKEKKSFSTDKFEIETKKGRKFAIAKSPKGNKARRFVAKDFKK